MLAKAGEGELRTVRTKLRGSQDRSVGIWRRQKLPPPTPPPQPPPPPPTKRARRPAPPRRLGRGSGAPRHPPPRSEDPRRSRRRGAQLRLRLQFLQTGRPAPRGKARCARRIRCGPRSVIPSKDTGDRCLTHHKSERGSLYTSRRVGMVSSSRSRWWSPGCALSPANRTSWRRSATEVAMMRTERLRTR